MHKVTFRPARTKCICTHTYFRTKTAWQQAVTITSLLVYQVSCTTRYYAMIRHSCVPYVLLLNSSIHEVSM